MRLEVCALLMMAMSLPCEANDIGSIKCGTNSVGEMLGSGWSIIKDSYLASVEPNRLELEDGSIYRADMTVGMLRGDRALVLVKSVRTKELTGDIFNLCAGGFDAWVTPGE